MGKRAHVEEAQKPPGSVPLQHDRSLSLKGESQSDPTDTKERAHTSL